tara:strand:+ start:1573 stop:2559 length:987 start_codon:yes stop_codon:yes gene_type:complete
MATENPQVVVSIKPIHSLVSAVMEGVATPTLLVKTGSPHAYTLRPSEAKALANAGLVIWVGHELESFLEKPLQTVANNAQKLELSEQLESSLLATRNSGEWQHADHNKHIKDGLDEHEDHEQHLEDGLDEHEDHEQHHEDGLDEDEQHTEEAEEHHHSSMDLHLWLDPKIAQKIVIETTKMLVDLDPEHALQYQSNSMKLNARLTLLDLQLKQKLQPVKAVPYLVFHSAYQYFEAAYDLNAIGSVTIDPDRKPGVKGIAEIRQKVKESGARCVFSEPQFQSSLVTTIIEATGAKTGVLDPLGSEIPEGPEAYFILINNLADNLVAGLQ